MFKGVTFGYYAGNGYFSSKQAKIEVDRIGELGIPWICLVSTIMQEAYYSTRMFRDFRNTPGDDELIEIIDYIHSKGIKVMLRPMIECWDGTQRSHVTLPQGEIQPGLAFHYRDDWFRNYAAVTSHYLRLANKTGCEAYGLDSELNNLIDCSDHWMRIVELARSSYKGHLTTSFIRTENYVNRLDNKDFWFYALDSVGTSFYYPATKDGSGSVEDMVETLRPYAVKMTSFAEKLGTCFYLGECGCCSVENATKLPYFWKNGKYYDGKQQADYMDAVIRLFEELKWWGGLFWWKWDQQIVRPDFLDDPAGDKGFIIYGKPAAEVMRKWCIG
jgi:hypothetical protein